MSSLISIITINFNEAVSLSSTIKSIRNAIGQLDVEVIVVDGAS
jgi:glycosyltransferase involved in cell wall biosynthesis